MLWGGVLEYPILIQYPRMAFDNFRFATCISQHSSTKSPCLLSSLTPQSILITQPFSEGVKLYV